MLDVSNLTTSKKDFAIVTIILASVSIAFFSSTVFKGLYPYQRDITYIFQPQQAFSNQFIQGGQLPLWNIYSYLGMPFMANWQSRVFSPLTLPFYFFNSVAGMRIFYPVVMFLAGFFAFCFLRYKNFGLAASLIGAFVWMLGGYWTTKLEFFSYASTLLFAFAPLIFVAHPVMAGISLALAFLGGYPVFFLIILLYALFAVQSSKDVSLFKRIKILVVALAVFAAIVMIQLLPTAELVRWTNISFTGGYQSEVMSANSVVLRDILNFLLPYYSKSINDVNVSVPHWLKNFYVGVVGCVLLLIGIYEILLNRKERYFARGEGYLWIGLFVGGFFLSFEVVYKALAENVLWALKFFRYPSTMMFLSALSAVFLCSLGFEKIFYKERKAIMLGVIILICVMGELFVRGAIIRNRMGYASGDYFYEPPPAVKVLRKDMNESMERFVLAPKTLKISMLKGKDILDGWRTARYLLKGFVALPYRLMNIYGFGEPLVPYYAESLADKVYGAQTPDAAADVYGKILGAKYLLSVERFDDKIVKRYEPLLMPQDSRCYIYRLKEDAFVFKITTDDNKYHEPLSPLVGTYQDRMVFEISDISGDKNYFFRAAAGGWHYPGWKVYINGRKSEIKVDDDFTLNIPLMSSVKNKFNTYKIVLLYSPLSFIVGLGCSLASACWICGFCVSRLLGVSGCQG